MISSTLYNNPSDEEYNNISKQLNDQIIVFTSNIPEEGKTTISSGIAESLSKAGKKVLLIDGDYHKGILSKKYGFDNSRFGLLKDYEKAIFHINNNLDLFVSGRSENELNILLKNNMLQDYINRLSYDYDNIIIDTTPLGMVNNAIYFSKSAGGVIMVNSNKPKNDYRLISDLEYNLNNLNAPIVGIVNNVFDNIKE